METHRPRRPALTEDAIRNHEALFPGHVSIGYPRTLSALACVNEVLPSPAVV